ncbi:hypothetical protein N752_29510 [Desulforamulus aquiferis]|nr:hypothetical protein N752_29510 [Desulforamulus aquiferis]
MFISKKLKNKRQREQLIFNASDKLIDGLLLSYPSDSFDSRLKSTIQGVLNYMVMLDVQSVGAEQAYLLNSIGMVLGGSDNTDRNFSFLEKLEMELREKKVTRICRKNKPWFFQQFIPLGL